MTSLIRCLGYKSWGTLQFLRRTPYSPPFFNMTPPVAVYSETERVTELIGKPTTMKIEAQDHEVLEDYNGKYQFAPIEEAQVSRAMIKRRVST